MSDGSVGNRDTKRKSRSREGSRHQSSPIQPVLPLLGQVIDDEGDMKNLDLGEDAFTGFHTDLRDSEVLRLIDTIYKDDVSQFSSFNMTRLDSLTMNAKLTDLPVSNNFSNVLYEWGT